MFEDETVDVHCPACGHLNSLAVRAFEEKAEQHIVCDGCKKHIRIEGTEFQHRLDAISAEVRELEKSSASPPKPKQKPGSKDNWQI